MEKTINIKIKISFQLPLKTKEIDFRCLRGYRLAKKDKINQDYQNEHKNKSIYPKPYFC